MYRKRMLRMRVVDVDGAELLPWWEGMRILEAGRSEKELAAHKERKWISNRNGNKARGEDESRESTVDHVGWRRICHGFADSRSVIHAEYNTFNGQCTVYRIQS